MASNYSRYSSVRVYRRYCFGAIFSGLLSMGATALFVMFMISPMIGFKGPDGITTVNGLQYVLYSLRTFFKIDNLPDILNYDKFIVFEDYMKAYADSNQLLGTIKNIFPYIEVALMALLAVVVIIMVILGIVGLVFVIAGRIHNPRSPASMATASFFIFMFFLGLLFLYLFFAQQMINSVVAAGADPAVVSFNLLNFGYLGGLFILMLALNITYGAAFKNRVYAGLKKRGEAAPEPAPANNNQQPQYYGQPQNMSYQQMNNQAPYGGSPNPQTPARQASQMGPATLPPDLRVIGDHAYSKCLSLRDATIPSGVTNIGPSAFSNCLNLETVYIPLSVREIGYNCFFNTPKMRRIVYQGRVEDWKRVNKGSNWLTHSGVNIIEAVDGKIAVNTQ